MISLLIVDDEISIRSGIKENIDWESYGIWVCGLAENATVALDILASNPPDIIIMDINMPHISGLELLEIIRDKYPNIYVILISGYRDFDNAQKAVNLNAFAFISKPIDLNLLLENVINAKNKREDRLAKLREDSIVQAKLLENLNILNDYFFTRLLHGSFTSEQELTQKTSSLSLELNCKQYMVGIIDVDCKQELAGKDEGLYRAVLQSKLEGLFRLDFFHVFRLEKYIGLVFGGHELDKNSIIKELSSLSDWVKEEAGFSITIALGSICEEPLQIPYSYRSAISALDYKLVIGNNQVIDSDNFTGGMIKNIKQPNFYRFLKNIETELIVSLKSCDTEVLDTRMCNTIDVMRTHIEENINSRSNILFTLAFYLYHLLVELDIYEDVPYDGNEIHIKLLQLSTLNEVKQFLYEFFTGICKDIKGRSKSQCSLLVSKVLQYVSDNIYEQISLGSAADFLNVHPNYLSKIIKDSVGETFTDYVIKEKMKEAKRLLKTSNLRVYAISDMLKYNDSGYFIKLFRKIYGTSPNEYRQLLTIKNG